MSNNQLFQLLDLMPQPVCITNTDTNNIEILFSNPSFDQALALKHVQSFFQSDDKEIQADKRWFQVKKEQDTLDDKPVFVLSFQDVTSYKNALLEADALSEMKSNFLATMSHEIRTPMQSIYGFLEIMNESTEDSDMLHMISTAKSSASGLLEILDDILDLAKADAGKMELDDFDIPVRTLARGLLEGLAVKADGKEVKLIDDIEQNVPFVVKGDPKRLRQVIMNLVGNSIKFTEEGSVTLKLTTDAKVLHPKGDDLTLRCEVIDTGIGMPPEVSSKLFQPFTQADNSTTRRFGGTGLGLSISKKLIELMGGVIGVDSVEGKGSTFWFEIPTREAEDNSAEIKLPNLDGITVLSVEDHPQGAKEIVNSLRSMGAEVDSTPDYDTALEWVKNKPFDVAIIDYGLPGSRNGLDLTKAINKLRPFMGLIMYTVHNDIQIQHDLKTLGGTYLSKPASRLGLGQAVKSAAKQTGSVDFNGPKKLLVAEDTQAVCDVLSRQFGLLGIEADFVANGKQALDALKTNHYGLMITDLHMPEVDGYQLIKAVRENEEKHNVTKRFPVIAMTADVQLAHRQAYMTYGFDECLLKPVSIGQLRRLFIRWGLLIEEEQQQSNDKPEEAPAASTKPQVKGLPPAIDTKAVVHQMGAFDDSAIEMLHMFVDLTTPLIQKLNDACVANDTTQVREVAHSLKGAAKSACCNHLGSLAEKLQYETESGNLPDINLQIEINNEFERVRHELKTLKA